jgi:hypothetical protein
MAVAVAMTSRDNLRETENRHACYFALSATGVKFAFVASAAKHTSGKYRKQTTEGVAFLLISVLCELSSCLLQCLYLVPTYDY